MKAELFKGSQMKLFIIFLTALFSFAGCSTTHYLQYSKSHDKFYDDYNNSAGHKDIEVVLNNDSLISRDNHSVIRNDTLYIFKEESEEKEYVLPVNDIKKLNYLSNDYKTADLLLSNGDKIKAEGISFLEDSIRFKGLRDLIYKTPLVPVSDINVVSYKNHLRGTIQGVLGGTLLGGALGATGWIFKPPDGHGGIDRLGATIGGVLSGFIIGGVVGYIIGYNVNYQFSPGR